MLEPNRENALRLACRQPYYTKSTELFALGDGTYYEASGPLSIQWRRPLLESSTTPANLIVIWRFLYPFEFNLDLGCDIDYQGVAFRTSI